MKSFLDRFRRKESEADASPAPVTPASGAPKKGAKPADPDFNKHHQTLEIGEVEEGPGYAPTLLDPSAAMPSADALVLELGDFLHRIPEHLLKPGTHDASIPMAFALGEVADRVARGETTVALTEIYRKVPQIFQSEVLPADNVEIRFPWQKVIKMIRESAAAAYGTGEVTESLAHKLRARRGGQAAAVNGDSRAIAAASAASKPVARQVSWFGRPEAAVVPAASSATVSPPSLPKGGKPLPKEVDLSTPPTVDDPRLSREEILRARDAAVLQLSRIRVDHERQIALLQQERQMAFEQRDRAIAELERMEEKTGQLESDKTPGSKTNDPARSQKEYKRQVDELNRRIQTLEANQKERTVEFGREKEARLKAERLLAASERTLAENAAQMEKMWQREDDLARIRESLPKDEAMEQIRKAYAERDEALAKLRVAEHAAKESGVQVIAKEQEIAALRAERDTRAADLAEKEKALKALDANHEAAIHAVRTDLEEQLVSKDDALAKLTMELDRTAAETSALREQVLLSFAADKEALISSHRAEIASLAESHESRAAELAAEKQHALEALAAEADHAIAMMARERDEKAADAGGEQQRALQALAAEKDEQIAQRDEVILAITAERDQKVGELEREIERVRKERDAVVQQREELRRQIEQPGHHPQVPDEPSPMPEPQPIASVVAEVEHVEDSSVPLETMRTLRERPSRTHDVIGVSESELMEERRLGANIPLPPVRPVPIHPPQVRTLE